MSVIITPVPAVVATVQQPSHILAQVNSPASVQATLASVGPQGVPGVGGSAYDHIQTAASDVWIINHNLGRRPSITLIDAGGSQIVGEVLHLSANQARAYFAIPISGSARCI